MTPGLHRTHHASTPEYYNANFGAVLSVWDRWFGTLAPPLPERNAPSFGVPSFEAKQYARPHWALLMPFMLRRRPAALYRPENTVSGLDNPDSNAQISGPEFSHGLG